MDDSQSLRIVDVVFPHNGSAIDGYSTPVASGRRKKATGCCGIKASFSMSSLRDIISPEKELPGTSTAATLPRHKKQDGLRRVRSCSNKDEFWAALQSDYNYLMDDGLIETCKEANGELSCDDEEMLSEFHLQHDKICAQIETLENEISTKDVQLYHMDRIKSLNKEVEMFNEHSQRLLRHNPDMSDEIHRVTDHLNGLWDAVQHCVTPSESQDEKTTLRREIACEMRFLRKWVREMEEQLGPLILRPDWERSECEARLTRHMGLQKEIESRVKNVLAVVNHSKKFHEYDGNSRDGERVIRTALSLQHRFHDLWLRSLEWLCCLEDLIRGAGGLRESNAQGGDQSDSDDLSEEPRVKCRRLVSGGPSHDHQPSEKEPGQAASHRSGRNRTSGVRSRSAMVRGRRHAATMDCQDVGYSSESSVHLSNEDAVGECVRVYTYTSAEATSPRVLDMVMKGNHMLRTTPPTTPSNAQSVARSLLGDDGLAVTDSPGPNCGLYYFRHEDSDKDHHHHGPMHHSSPIHLSSDEDEEYQRDRAPLSDGELGDDDDIHSVNSSDMDVDDSLGPLGVRQNSPDGIHKLVNLADLMVRVPRPIDFMRRVINYPLGSEARRFESDPLTSVVDSCDASGEYTTTSTESDDSTSSIRERKGSVIYLKGSGELPPLTHSRSGAGDSKSSPLKMRTNKRRNIGDRPKSFAESTISSYIPSLATSYSETALHGLNPGCADFECFLKITETSGLDSTPRTRRCRRYPGTKRSSKPDLSYEDKCQSLCSLRRSSSSENGRSKTSSGSYTSLGVVDNNGERRHSVGIISDSETGSVAQAIDGDLCSTSATSATALDGMWDDYQVSLYPSDAYSEQDVDVDALINFGDDYRKFISDGTSTPTFPSHTKERLLRKVDSRRLQSSGGGGDDDGDGGSSNCSNSGIVYHHRPADLDSESDYDDVKDFVDQNRKHLLLMERELMDVKKRDPSESGQPRSMAEFLATCHHLIRCLEPLCVENPSAKVGGVNVAKVGEEFHRRWQKLLMEAEDFQVNLSRLDVLQKEVVSFRKGLTECQQKFQNVADQICDEASLQSALSSLAQEKEKAFEDYKSQLRDLNYRVNDFVTNSGLEVACLRNELVGLYQKWDEVHDKIEQSGSWIGQVEEAWKQFVEKLHRLEEVQMSNDAVLHQMTVALERTPEEFQSVIAKASFSDLSQIGGVSELRKLLDCQEISTIDTVGDSFIELAEMKHASRHLRELLGCCPATKYVSDLEKVAVEKAEAQKNGCQQLVLKMMSLLDPQNDSREPCNVEQQQQQQRLDIRDTVNSDVTGSLSSASQRRCRKHRSGHKVKIARSEVKRDDHQPSSTTLLWRVIRAALPIQFVVVVLFCFACLLEPHCCDTVNNINMSLAPQLRYVRGPPPI